MTFSAAIPTRIFLHGLDSSGQGTKGQYFKKHFANFLCPDFSGDLAQRLRQLENIGATMKKLLLVGSSFGGLMATCYAVAHPAKIEKLILLAPALNFANFLPPNTTINIPTLLIIGKKDTVTPPHLVIPLAETAFTHLKVILADDDHLLHTTFKQLDWPNLLN
jgi:pimeloyl-ACP methyl ester carboxylesterase